MAWAAKRQSPPNHSMESETVSMKDWSREGGGGCVVAVGIASILYCRWSAIGK
jgi:hypothetical protein